jgi:homocysteine S-methyltransferase
VEQTDFLVPYEPLVGCIGPEGDGYHIDHKVTAEEAETCHREQIRTFKAAGTDLVSAYTINNVEEATGIVKAAPKEAISVVISFTVEIDGRLPSGQPMGEAISQVDYATEKGPAYFMTNCAHPSHFRDVPVDGRECWPHWRHQSQCLEKEPCRTGGMRGVGSG